MPFEGCLIHLAALSLENNRGSKAEPLLRECLARRQRDEPDRWTTFSVQSRLGLALLQQKQYAAAERMLVQGYEGMKQRDAAGRNGGL